MAQSTEFHGACILAQSKPDDTGYARTQYNGRTVRAHRAAYMQAGGVIPSGWHIHHLCRVKLCINPVHLLAVSRRDHAFLHREHADEYYRSLTTCKLGHPLDGYSGRARFCRTCAAASKRRHRERTVETGRDRRNETRRIRRAYQKAHGLKVE